GLERAKRYLLTGDEIPAPDAARIGLVLETVADDRLQEHALAFARRMAQVPTSQLVMLKLLCNQTAENMGLSSSRTLGSLFDGGAAGVAGVPRTRGEHDEPRHEDPLRAPWRVRRDHGGGEPPAAPAPGRSPARPLLGASRGRRPQAREAAPDRLPLRERGRTGV